MQNWLWQLAMLGFIIAGSLYILNLGYGFEGSFKPLKEFHFVSDLLTGQNWNSEQSTAARSVQQVTGTSLNNRFDNSLLGDVPVPFPANYLRGIDIQQRDFEGYTFKSYLRGEFRAHGWWWYYLYAIAIKVPLGTWLIGLVTFCSRIKYGDSPLRTRDEIVLLAPSLVVFEIASYKCGFSHHLHYILICFPFIFIWISQAAGLLMQLKAKWWRLAKSQLMSLLIAAGLSWSIVSSLWIYPHGLSYFNEPAGGPKNGPKHLLHSNIDWGQDLRYLGWWMEKHPAEQPFHLAYFGRIDPANVETARNTPLASKPRNNSPTNAKPGECQFRCFEFARGEICDKCKCTMGFAVSSVRWRICQTSNC